MGRRNSVAVFMGLDLGGSGAKAVAFDERGRLLARSKVPYAPVVPAPGLLEFDPAAQWSALVEAVRGCSAGLASRHSVVAMGVSVAGEAVLPVDSSGNPLANSIASVDRRGSDQVTALKQRLGAEAIYRITGQPPDSIYAICRAMWFRENRPALAAKTWKFLLWHEYFLLRLGLPPVLDRSNAARTMAYDIATGGWSKSILDAAGMDDCCFAPVAESFTPLGELSAEVAAELGLSSRPLVVVAGFDQACAALGAGVTHEGLGFVGSGSVEALAAVTAWNPQSGLLRSGEFSTGPAIPGERFLTVGTNFGAGNLIAWLARLLMGARSRPGRYATLLPKQRPERGTDVMVIPHVNGAFSPHRDPSRHAAIVGVTGATSRDDIVWAAMEGIAFQLRSMARSMEAAGFNLTRVRNSGGGAESELSAQLRADILGRPVETLTVADTAPLGAAIAAAIGSGTFWDADSAASEMVHVHRVFEPDEHRARDYDQRYDRYTRLDQRLTEDDHDR
jgi:xylulokinase